MNKLLRFSLITLLMMAFGMRGAASTGKIVFSTLGLENSIQYSAPFDGGDFTVTFAGGANDGKYYNAGTGIRTYGNGTITVAAKDASMKITKITITYDGSNKPNSGDNIVKVGSYDYGTGVWTGSESSVVFTRPSGSGHWRVQAVEATVEGNAGPTVAAPTISGETPFVDKTTVTIETTVSGGKIFYTTDGTNPTESNSSKEYTGPFDLTETTTVKAYVIEATGAASSVAEKTFTKLLKYKKATTVEDGKGYLLVADSRVAKPFTANYSWLYVDKVTIEDDGTILQAGQTNEFVFNAVSGGYTITMSDGRQLYQDGNYNNFYGSAKPTVGYVWSVKANGDGTFTITNNDKNKYIQYSTTHGSYGSYDTAQDGGILPELYVVDDGSGSSDSNPVVETIVVTFDAAKDKANAEERGDMSVTKNGIVMHITDGVLGSGYKSGQQTVIANDYRFYANSTLTFTAPAGYTITKIEFTGTANATASNGLGGFDTPSAGSLTLDGKTGLWTGNASQVEFVAKKQVRAVLINVTLVASGGGSSSATTGSTLANYPYADEELIEKAKELIEKLQENDDEALAEELSELMKDVARSHALGEGLDEAEDFTELLGEWTTELFEDGEGTEGEGYYTAEGKDIEARVYQTIQLPAGRYMLTATGRGQQYPTYEENYDERLQVMAINNDKTGRYYPIARTNHEGGVYGDGWDDKSAFFTMTADGEATIGACFIPKAGTDSWGEVGNFRLVRLGDATLYMDCWTDFYNDEAAYIDVVVHRTLREGEWNSFAVPFNVTTSTITSQFGNDAEVALFTGMDKAGTTALFETLDEDELFIPANTPVLLKPSKVKLDNMYLFYGVGMNRTTPKAVKKDGVAFTAYYNYKQTPAEGGYGFDLEEKDGYWTALTTSAVLLTDDGTEIETVTVDGEAIAATDAEDLEETGKAKINVVGAAVEHDIADGNNDGESETTGIGFSTKESSNAKEIYNMAGQRVSDMAEKGLYIVNGKKVVKK